MKRILIVLFLSLLFFPRFSFAWGSKGHALIAEVAFKYLDPQTRTHVMGYLGGMSIQQAANWMDEVRSDPAYNYMKPYHYADFEKGEPATAVQGENVVGVLLSTLQDLNHSPTLSQDEIKIRLLYLLHLVGDIHQPLHVGYPDDKGGNLFQVSFLGRGTNLHKVWDTEIIDYDHMSLTDVLGSQALSPARLKQIQQINIVAWANESRSYLGKVYSVQGHKIGLNYIRMATPIIERQLLFAGVRLAGVLEKYFRNVAAPAVPASRPHSLQADTTVPTVPISEAQNYEGKEVKICTRVYGTKFLSSSGRKPTFLDLGAPYPDSPLTIVIWGDDRGNFPNPPETYYRDKDICVTGRILIYKGKPEIIVRDPHQIIVK